jgi:hypothetical protein
VDGKFLARERLLHLPAAGVVLGPKAGLPRDHPAHPEHNLTAAAPSAAPAAVAQPSTGPLTSQGHFGSLLTSFLTAAPAQEATPAGPPVDEGFFVLAGGRDAYFFR